MNRTGLVLQEKMVQENQLFLRLLQGFRAPTSGLIDMSKDVTIGYLPQQMRVDDTTTVLNETITAFSELIGLSEEIEFCSSEISKTRGL